MKLTAWMPKLTVHEQKLRAAHGLIPKRDGWYKSIEGKTRYVCKPCPLSEVIEILDVRLAAIRAKLRGGSAPVQRVTPGLLTLEALAEMYLAWLRQRVETGVPRKFGRRTYVEVARVLSQFVGSVGNTRAADSIGPSDFSAYAKQHLAGKALSTQRRNIIYIEAFANWASPGSRKAGLLTKPWQFGPDLRRPTDTEIAVAAADKDKAYSPAQLRKAFLAVRKTPALRAAGWLGLCGAFGPKDIGTMPEALVNLDTGYIRFPRGKTGFSRLAWLPPAARIALRRYMAQRPGVIDPSAKGLLFRTKTGMPYYRDPGPEDPTGYKYDTIGYQWGRKTGLPFSGLRATFATWADDAPDQRAVDLVLGHSGHHASSIRSRHYAKAFNPERVRELVQRVVKLAMGHSKP
jgi:integrase